MFIHFITYIMISSLDFFLFFEKISGEFLLPFVHLWWNNGEYHFHSPAIYFDVCLTDIVHIASWWSFHMPNFVHSQEWICSGVFWIELIYFIGSRRDPHVDFVRLTLLDITHFRRMEKQLFINEFSARCAHYWFINQPMDTSRRIPKLSELFTLIHWFIPFMSPFV